jgi:RNA polymerase sigma factor for flagellar operon FliA
MRMKTPAPSAGSRDDLVMQHVGLVKLLAQRLAHRVPSHVEVDDLIGVGVLGLIDAATRYKPDTGVPFDAFARRRIHGAMLDSLRELDWAPRSMRRMRRNVESAIGSLRRTLGREPAEPEIAAALSQTTEEYAKTIDQLRTLEVGAIRSLDAPTEDGATRLELCVDPDEGVVAKLERQEMRALLARAITTLPERERHILAMYYEEEMTLAEIGAVIGVGESRVSQLRTQAIARLRATLAETIAPERKAA